MVRSRGERYYRLGIISRILALFGKYRISRFFGLITGWFLTGAPLNYISLHSKSHQTVTEFINQLALGIFGGLKRTLVQIYTLVSQNGLCGVGRDDFDFFLFSTQLGRILPCVTLTKSFGYLWDLV